LGKCFFGSNISIIGRFPIYLFVDFLGTLRYPLGQEDSMVQESELAGVVEGMRLYPQEGRDKKEIIRILDCYGLRGIDLGSCVYCDATREKLQAMNTALFQALCWELPKLATIKPQKPEGENLPDRSQKGCNLFDSLLF
jgi:hypothetical protein